jgi:hypothetical protein
MALRITALPYYKFDFLCIYTGMQFVSEINMGMSPTGSEMNGQILRI